MDDKASSVRLARVDWADYLPGDDEALHVRQVIAHDVFGEELWADERVRAFFAPWFDKFDRVLSAVRKDMDDDALTALFAALYREMVEPLVDLCVRLSVPPWVSVDLQRRFTVKSSSRIAGEDAWLRTAIEYVEPPATADYEATFKIRKGMTKEECVRALGEFVARVMVETGMHDDSEATRSRRNPLPKNEGKELERDTRWYYRRVICGEQLSEIARKDVVSYQLVQSAIKRVRPLVEIFVLPEAPTKKRTARRHVKPRKVRRRMPRR
jgi:hypothetical protein